MHRSLTQALVAAFALVLCAGCTFDNPNPPTEEPSALKQFPTLLVENLERQSEPQDTLSDWDRREQLREEREARLAHPIVTPPSSTSVSPVLMAALVDWIRDESATRNVLLREPDYIGGRIIFRSGGTRYPAAYHPPMVRDDDTVYRQASISFWARPDGTSGQDALRTWDAWVDTGLVNFGVGPEPYQRLFNGENCKSEDLQVCVDMGACESTSDCIHKMYDEDFGCEPPIEFRCEPGDALHWQQEHIEAMQVAKRLFRLEG